MRTPEHNAKIAVALRGRRLTDEHRKNMSSARAMQYCGDENPNWRGGEWMPLTKKQKARVYNAAKHARKHGRVSTLTLSDWLAILEEYGHRCAYCFLPFEELDHIKSIAYGGDNTSENVVPSCRLCNRRKAGRNGRSSDWVPSIASRFWPRLAEELYA